MSAEKIAREAANEINAELTGLDTYPRILEAITAALAAKDAEPESSGSETPLTREPTSQETGGIAIDAARSQSPDDANSTRISVAAKPESLAAQEKPVVEKLIELWSKDPSLQFGVPYRRMATEAAAALATASAPPAAAHETSNTERMDWIIDNCTRNGGGNGFELKVFVPVDSECIRGAIDEALSRARK